jgi:hypothetical protein
MPRRGCRCLAACLGAQPATPCGTCRQAQAPCWPPPPLAVRCQPARQRKPRVAPAALCPLSKPRCSWAAVPSPFLCHRAQSGARASSPSTPLHPPTHPASPCPLPAAQELRCLDRRLLAVLHDDAYLRLWDLTARRWGCWGGGGGGGACDLLFCRVRMACVSLGGGGGWGGRQARGMVGQRAEAGCSASSRGGSRRQQRHLGGRSRQQRHSCSPLLLPSLRAG